MTFSVRLTPEERAILDEAARRASRSRSELVREALRDHCALLVRPLQSAFELGKGLFGGGTLARAPRDRKRRAAWQMLRSKKQSPG